MTVADLVKAYRTGPARLQRSDAWAPTPLEHAGMYVYLKGEYREKLDQHWSFEEVQS